MIDCLPRAVSPDILGGFACLGFTTPPRSWGAPGITQDCLSEPRHSRCRDTASTRKRHINPSANPRLLAVVGLSVSDLAGQRSNTSELPGAFGYHILRDPTSICLLCRWLHMDGLGLHRGRLPECFHLKREPRRILILLCFDETAKQTGKRTFVDLHPIPGLKLG